MYTLLPSLLLLALPSSSSLLSPSSLLFFYSSVRSVRFKIYFVLLYCLVSPNENEEGRRLGGVWNGWERNGR